MLSCWTQRLWLAVNAQDHQAQSNAHTPLASNTKPRREHLSVPAFHCYAQSYAVLRVLQCCAALAGTCHPVQACSRCLQPLSGCVLLCLHLLSFSSCAVPRTGSQQARTDCPSLNACGKPDAVQDVRHFLQRFHHRTWKQRAFTLAPCFCPVKGQQYATKELSSCYNSFFLWKKPRKCHNCQRPNAMHTTSEVIL